MKKYIACFTISIKEHVVYPGILWTNLLSKFIYIIFQFTVWTTLFVSSGKMQQIEYQTETINYILTAVIVSPLFESYTIEWINGQIRSGNIVLELVRPLDFRKKVFARCVGETFVQIFFCVLPLYMIVAIFIDDYNLCDEQMIYGIISIILAYGIRFLYSLSIGLLAFWLIVTWPLNMFLGAIY